jgi:hypothetical protein
MMLMDAVIMEVEKVDQDDDEEDVKMTPAAEATKQSKNEMQMEEMKDDTMDKGVAQAMKDAVPMEMQLMIVPPTPAQMKGMLVEESTLVEMTAETNFNSDQ